MDHESILSSPRSSKSSRKIFQLMGVRLDNDASLKDHPRSESRMSVSSSMSSRKVFQLMGVHVDTDTSLQDQARSQSRSQSRMSVSSSESGYSQDGIDREYSTSRAARRPSSVEDVKDLQADKGMFYLQAVTYSASASEIKPSESKSIPDQLTSEHRPLRHKDRVQSASPHSELESRNGRSKSPNLKSPLRSHETLDEMITHERKRFDAEEFAKRMWKPTIGRPEAKTLNNKPRSPEEMKENGTTSPAGFTYGSTSSLAPPPLIFRDREDRRQSISHFSEQSDDESPGMMSKARDSVMSHLRPSPIRSSAHRLSYAEKFNTPGRLLMPPLASKRKRLSKAKGKHPLKSPFPFPIQNNSKHSKKPQWPPPGQHIPVTKSSTPSFSKRLSGVMRRFSTGSGSAGSAASGSGSGHGSTSPDIQSISTEARDSNGPDTPSLPTSSNNKIGGMFSMSSLNISSPKFLMKEGGGGAEGLSRGPAEKMMSPKEILEKGSMRFSGAIESARKKAGVKSRSEKRRDFIRANIVKIGQADQFPDGRVNQWL